MTPGRFQVSRNPIANFTFWIAFMGGVLGGTVGAVIHEFLEWVLRR